MSIIPDTARLLELFDVGLTVALPFCKYAASNVALKQFLCWARDGDLALTVNARAARPEFVRLLDRSGHSQDRPASLRPHAEPCDMRRLGHRDDPAQPAIGLELQLTFDGSTGRKRARYRSSSAVAGPLHYLRPARQRAPPRQCAGKARDPQV